MIYRSDVEYIVDLLDEHLCYDPENCFCRKVRVLPAIAKVLAERATRKPVPARVSGQ